MTKKFAARADLCSLTIINYVYCTNVVIDKGRAPRSHCTRPIKLFDYLIMSVQ